MAPNYWWVQPLVTLFVGFVAMAMAGLTIRWNRHMARLKATLDFIEGTESKQFYQERYKAFRSFRDDRAFCFGSTDEENNKKKENRYQCLDFLNHYELGAIACFKGIIDEEFYAAWYRPAIVRDWNDARDLILEAREPRKPGDPGGPEALTELELLAVRWGGRLLPFTSLPPMSLPPRLQSLT